MGSSKAPAGVAENGLGTIYRKNSGLNNFWQNSSITTTSMGNIKRNRSKEGLIQQNARQNLHLKLKKKVFTNPKKSIGETRREINMPTLNSQNRKNPHEKYSLHSNGGMSKDNPLTKSENNRPGHKPNASLDKYHTKSFEDVMQSSSSIIFKNLQKTKPQAINYQMNRKILAALANKKFNEEVSAKAKASQEVIVVEENSIDASDAYSYCNDTKKGSTKLRTQDSTTDHPDENQSDNTIYDKISGATVHSQVKPQKQNSFSHPVKTEVRSEEEKQYGSDRRVNEYDDTLDKSFDSPVMYKAISPSPKLNTSAMSKEVGLDDRTSKIKEENTDRHPDSVEFPLTAAKTIIHYGKYLSEFEESEILNYMVVYYINTNIELTNAQTKGKKKQRKAKKDLREIKVVKGEHLAYRYEIIESLGKGAFGEVLKCYDHKEKEETAIKILKNSVENYEQGMNEVNILKYIKDNDPEDVRNIIKVKDSFIFRNQICIGFEIMDMNLYDVIKGRNFRGMKVKYIRRIALHILVGLCFLSRQSVIHCDLKPENILLKKKDDQKGYLIKIIDFGSACFKDNIIYSYVQSRFYRAPEISLGIRDYSYAIDMWSFG